MDEPDFDLFVIIMLFEALFLKNITNVGDNLFFPLGYLHFLSDIIVKRADLLLHYCHKVETLSESIKEYGPTYRFWLFSFERYNGILGKFPNNQKHIEVQLKAR